MMLNKEDILEKAKVNIKEIDVEGFGKIRCKDVSYAAYSKVMTIYENPGDQDAALFCECVIDENGKQMFSFDEVAREGILSVDFVTSTVKELAKTFGDQAKN